MKIFYRDKAGMRKLTPNAQVWAFSLLTVFFIWNTYGQIAHPLTAADRPMGWMFGPLEIIGFASMAWMSWKRKSNLADSARDDWDAPARLSSEEIQKALADVKGFRVGKT